MGIPLGRQPGFNTLHLPSIATRPIWLGGSILLAQEHQGQQAMVGLCSSLQCQSAQSLASMTSALGVASQITSISHKHFPKCQRCQSRTVLVYAAQEKADFQIAGGAGKPSALKLASPSRTWRGGTKTMCPRWLPHAAQSKTVILPFHFFFFLMTTLPCVLV